jgi:hypothetical protein
MTHAPPNNSFNASGDCVVFIIIPSLLLARFRAAALIRALDTLREIKRVGSQVAKLRKQIQS